MMFVAMLLLGLSIAGIFIVIYSIKQKKDIEDISDRLTSVGNLMGQMIDVLIEEKRKEKAMKH